MLWKKCLKSLAVLACFCLPYNAYAEADALDPEGMINVMPGADDATVQIDLGHVFPYYGGLFTNAWMSTNGVILLYDPVSQFGNPYTNNSMCCNGIRPGGYDGYFSYMLAPLWTDLIDRNLTADDGYYYSTGEGGSSFLWYNVNEFYNENTNTFQVNLWPDGSFDFLYDEVDITNHDTWIGFTGDASYQNDSGVYEEVNELMFAQGGMTEFDIEFHDATFPGGRAWYGTDGGYDSNQVDCSNPLNDPSCSGYEEAYYNQQCSNDPLYDTGCAGYEQAYYDQQCGIDPLYDSGCTGYQEAYYNQQCQNSPLYDSGCPGYEEAYFNQQCSQDPLYDSACPGYEEANYNYQCGLDPLYDSGCPGYEEAYFNQQCEANPLYDQACPGYQVAYDALMFAEACSADPLYDTGCDGYEEALALQMVDEQTETIIEESIAEEEDYGYEEETFTEDYTGQEEFIDDGIPDFTEPEVLDTADEIYVEPPVEVTATEEEMFVEEMVLQESAPTEIFEETLDEYFVEEITPMEEDVSIFEEELLIEEEIEQIEEEIAVIEEEVAVEETVANNEDEKRTIRQEKQTRLLAIVTEVIADTVQQAQGNNNFSQNSEDLGEEITETDTEIVDFSVENEQIENESTSTLVAAEDTSYFSSSSTDLQGESGETVEETVESLTFSEQAVQFESDLTDSLATGQSLGQFLSGVQPDFGKFDVAPPAPQEQKQMARAEQALSSMSQEEIEETLKENVESNTDDGGFDTDQRLTLVIMGYNPNFSQYNTVLTDNQAWYVDRNIYRGKAVHDNMRRNINLLLGSDAKHRALVDLQYD